MIKSLPPLTYQLQHRTGADMQIDGFFMLRGRRQCLLIIFQGRCVRVGCPRCVPRLPQIFPLFREIITSTVVICQDFDRRIAGIRCLQVARQKFMQLSSRGISKALISYFLGDDMFEEIRQFRIGRVERREIQFG